MPRHSPVAAHSLGRYRDIVILFVVKVNWTLKRYLISSKYYDLNLRVSMNLICLKQATLYFVNKIIKVILKVSFFLWNRLSVVVGSGLPRFLLMTLNF